MCVYIQNGQPLVKSLKSREDKCYHSYILPNRWPYPPESLQVWDHERSTFDLVENFPTHVPKWREFVSKFVVSYTSQNVKNWWKFLSKLYKKIFSLNWQKWNWIANFRNCREWLWLEWREIYLINKTVQKRMQSMVLSQFLLIKFTKPKKWWYNKEINLLLLQRSP